MRLIQNFHPVCPVPLFSNSQVPFCWFCCYLPTFFVHVLNVHRCRCFSPLFQRVDSEGMRCDDPRCCFCCCSLVLAFFFFSERHQCCVLRFRDFKLVTTEQVDMILTCKESLGVLWFTGEKAALAGTDIFLPIPALLHVSMVVHFFASAQCMLTRETVDLFMFHLIALYFLITPRFFVGD